MDVEWDEDKRRGNLARHGIDFTEAARVFDGPHLLDEDIDHSFSENRWCAPGEV